MPYMYILECADGSYYTGSTWNLEKRLAEHQNGEGARHTAERLPVKLVFCQYFDRVADAFQREKQVQGWSRRKKQALIEANIDKLVEHSRNYTQYGSSTTAEATRAGTQATEPASREPASAEPVEAGLRQAQAMELVESGHPLSEPSAAGATPRASSPEPVDAVDAVEGIASNV